MTPIMMRAQLTSKKLIFVDSTSCCDSDNSTITLMLTATKEGAIPIAIFLHKGYFMESYKNVFSSRNMPTGICGNNYPLAFMTNVSDAEKNALKIWPSTQLLCQFHSNMINKIKTPNQAAKFLVAQPKFYKKDSKIYVQPTSISRQKFPSTTKKITGHNFHKKRP
ncbi:unnamed protein product [Gordionus sp. m RMFG-2023]